MLILSHLSFLVLQVDDYQDDSQPEVCIHVMYTYPM